MLKKYTLKLKDMYYGPYSFIMDILLFAVITYGFHLLFRYFALDIMSIPAVNESSSWLAARTYDISLWFDRHILGMQIKIGRAHV